jgi:hypothetical protein
MGMIITSALALSLWIALWAIGAKSFDGFLLAMLIILIGAGMRIAASGLPGNRPRD